MKNTKNTKNRVIAIITIAVVTNAARRKQAGAKST